MGGIVSDNLAPVHAGYTMFTLIPESLKLWEADEMLLDSILTFLGLFFTAFGSSAVNKYWVKSHGLHILLII